MIKRMNKSDFVMWENAQGYDLHYSAMSSIIKFDDIPAGDNVYDTVGRVMSEIAQDTDIDSIRVHWYNDTCVLIAGYPDAYHSFVIDGCIYIH